MYCKREAYLVILALGLASCTRNELIAPSNEPGTPFSIDALDFSKNYYFVDTSYVSAFPALLSGDSATHASTIPITNVQVWMSRPGAIPYPDEISGTAVLNLSAYTQPYPAELRNASEIVGEIESRRFYRLRPDQYSLPLTGRAGLLALRVPVVDQAVISVSYRRGSTICGETWLGWPPDTTTASYPVLLQLVKPTNLFSTGPLYPVAWRLLLKSVYSTGIHNIDKQNFRLNIFYRDKSTTTIFGQQLLYLLALDHRDGAGRLVPLGDGEFDFVPGITIDREYGEIILPNLEPFSNGLRAALHSTGIDVSPSDSALLPAIYDSVSVQAARYRGVYTIAGRAVGF